MTNESVTYGTPRTGLTGLEALDNRAGAPVSFAGLGNEPQAASNGLTRLASSVSMSGEETDLKGDSPGRENGKQHDTMSRKLQLSVVLALVLGLPSVLWLASCSKQPTAESSPIKIGVSLPLTGDAAVWGKSQQDGYELALEQINAKGGVSGRKAILIYGDDKGSARDGVSLLRKFIDVDQIQVLTGVANSSVALAYIPIIEKQKIVFVSSGASSPKLTGASKYFFRTWPSDIAEALAMAKYAAEKLGIKTVSCLYINNDYGIGLSEPFAKRFTQLGGKIVSKELFEQNATDIRAQLTKIKSQNPEGIYLAGNPREMARSISQARELGITARFLSISTLNDAEVFGTVRAADLEGTVITDASFDRNSDWPEAKKFMQEFRAKFGKEPGILANTAFDALMILAHAIERVGTDGDALSGYLHSMKEYKAVGGTLSFTAGGDVNRSIRISTVKNGHFVVDLPDFRQ
jgi:branched-chain amino acid transport system substrate-binding protein